MVVRSLRSHLPLVAGYTHVRHQNPAIQPFPIPIAHMTSETSTPQFPPEVMRYLKGPSSESRQFDFLIGDWNVEATRYKEDETPAFNYKAMWSARSLNEGRMMMDDFKALAPNGDLISSYVTLRTYSDATSRWEMVGLQALQPSVPAEWHGVSTDGGMLLDAITSLPNGQRVHTKIRFSEITSDTFSWQSSMSFDEGKTWRKTASLKAKRKADA